MVKKKKKKALALWNVPKIDVDSVETLRIRKIWVLVSAIGLKGHLKMKNCVLLEQISSHLTHTMQIMLWINIYITLSVCELKSLSFSSACIACFFTGYKSFEENTEPPPKVEIVSSLFYRQGTAL